MERDKIREKLKQADLNSCSLQEKNTELQKNVNELQKCVNLAV